MPVVLVERAKALSKGEFHARLRNWLANTSEETVGDPKGKGGRVFVRDGQSLYHLNPDTQRPGVEVYLILVDQHGDGLAWTAVPSASGKTTAVAYGPNSIRVSGFFLYVN